MCMDGAKFQSGKKSLIFWALVASIAIVGVVEGDAVAAMGINVVGAGMRSEFK
jgi:hypothetical protein